MPYLLILCPADAICINTITDLQTPETLVAMAEPFLGEIRIFAGNFAPRNWAFCDGQLVPVSQNAALFSLVGTAYGGDGRTTFGLPDLRGRLPMHPGSGPGLTARRLGQKGGAESVMLSEAQLPKHTHNIGATNNPGDATTPGGNIPAATGEGTSEVPATKAYANTVPNAELRREIVRPAGGGEAHDNMPPFLCVNFIIALAGVLPSRS